jgi:threonine/homoserine/homoserine lactone efflux protein
MFDAIWQGAVTGLVLATFIGPIFFTVVDLGLRGNIQGAAAVALGTFISDILWVLSIYLLAAQADPASTIIKVMYVAGGLILTGMGLLNLLKARVDETHPDTFNQNNNKLLIKGFLINATNPNVFFFWFGAVMVAVKQYTNKPALVLTHFFAALLMVFATDFLKGYAASFLRPYIKQATLTTLSHLSGLILIGFGIKLIFFH